MDDIVIAAVPGTMINVIWPLAMPHIQKVIDVSNGDLDMSVVKSKLQNGDYLLIAISDREELIAVNVLETRTLDSGLKIMYVPITGGNRLDDWMPRFLEVAKAIAKDYGCTELRGLAVRRGWLKKLSAYGWEEKHIVIGCNIED